MLMLFCQIVNWQCHYMNKIYEDLEQCHHSEENVSYQKWNYYILGIIPVMLWCRQN